MKRAMFKKVVLFGVLFSACIFVENQPVSAKVEKVPTLDITHIEDTKVYRIGIGKRGGSNWGRSEEECADMPCTYGDYKMRVVYAKSGAKYTFTSSNKKIVTTKAEDRKSVV